MEYRCIYILYAIVIEMTKIVLFYSKYDEHRDHCNQGSDCDQGSDCN